MRELTAGLTARLAARVVTTARPLARRVSGSGQPERGDVPGWVLVTMMTAGLVAGLWAVAGSTLNDLFRSAVSGVSGP